MDAETKSIHFSNPFKKLEREIKKGLNRLGDTIKHDVNKIGNEIKHDVNKIGNEIKHDVTAVAHKAESELSHAATQIKHEIEDISEKALDELEHDAKAVIEALFRELTKKGLRTGVNILKKAERLSETALKDAGFEVDISAVVLVWNDIGGRATDIRQKVESLLQKPPHLSRHYILEVIKAVAPDQVGLSLDVKLAALIVTSDDVGASFRFWVSTPAFLDASDEFFEAIGL